MKNFYIIVITAMLSMANIGCTTSDPKDKKRIAELEAIIYQLKATIYELKTTISELEEADSAIKDVVGTYEVIDNVDRSWIFTLNADKTATVRLADRDVTIYASWSEGWDYIEISYSTGTPNIAFPFGDIGSNEWAHDVQDGYIYYGWRDRKAKNPEKRLPFKKIK